MARKKAEGQIADLEKRLAAQAAAPSDHFVGDNLGPIAHVEFPILPEGGVVIFRGRCGVGKSTILRALETTVTGQGKMPSVRDGESKATLSGAGITITVSRSARRSGELELNSLSGRYNVADLVDPQLDDPAAADAARIKAICQLAQAPADRSRFLAACVKDPDDFNSLDPAVFETDDPVQMAGRIKRAFEARRRDALGQVERWQGEAEAHAKAIEGQTIEEGLTVESARAAHQQAVAEQTRLRGQQEQADKTAQMAEEARQRLAALRARTDLPAPEEAGRAILEAKEAMAREQEIEADLLARLDAIRGQIADSRVQITRLEGIHREALERASAIAEAEKTIGSVAAAAVTPAQVATADLAAEQAEKRLQDALRQDTVRKHREAGRQALDKRRAAQAAADKWDSAARATDQVLTDLVSTVTDALQVRDGRITTKTAARGETFYHDLSTGQRYAIAIPIAVRSMGDRGLLVLSHEAWQGAEPQLRDEILGLAQHHKTTVYTGEVNGDQQLAAHVYQPAQGSGA